MATPTSSLPESCCTCATLLPSTTSPIPTPSPSYHYDFSDETKSKKQRPTTPPPEPQIPQEPPRRLPCCSRLICSPCQTQNPRFASYCPFCQISDKVSSLPQGLREPPAYDESPVSTKNETAARGKTARVVGEAQDEPPPYSVSSSSSTSHNPTATQHPDTTHHLHPHDTLPALSLSYAVPAPLLRSHNNLFSDGLLPARRTILIPGSHYQGPSLSATPVESEEERVWKGRLRRFMVRSKCASYDVAGVYLKGALASTDKASGPAGESGISESGEEGKKDEVVEEAVRKWEEDERWEREHPFEKEKGKQETRKRRGFGGSLAGQLR